MRYTHWLALVLPLLGALSACPARAEVEELLVTLSSEDTAVVERANGDLYRLDLHQSCRLILGFQGRRLLILSPVRFLGADSRLLMPEYDLSCTIYRADSIGHVARAERRAPPAPDQGLEAMRQALELLGYNCGPLGTRGWTPDAAQAFVRYRQSKHLDSASPGLKRAITSLAIEVMRGRQITGTGLRLSRVIADQSDELVEFLWQGGGEAVPACGDQTFVRIIAADSSFFALGDGSVWNITTTQRAQVASWPISDGVMVCAERFINLRTGEMVRANRLR